MVGTGDGDANDCRRVRVRGPERDDPPTDVDMDGPLAFPERDPDALEDTTELYLMRRHAADDGSVTVQILGWEREGDAVTVEYSLPTGSHEADRYRWPTAGRYDESDFLAVVRGLGYPPEAAEHVAGEFARARRENGRWRIVTGRDGRNTKRGRASRRRGANDERTPQNRPRSSVVGFIRRRSGGVDPMDLGTGSVLLAFLSVLVPSMAAIPVGGLTAPIAAIGGILFSGALAALWLSIVVATTPSERP